MQAAGVPILVLANKQDLPGARDVPAVERELGLGDLPGSPLCCALPACAVTGEGLEAALEQLYQMIQRRRRTAKAAKKKR